MRVRGRQAEAISHKGPVGCRKVGFDSTGHEKLLEEGFT